MSLTRAEQRGHVERVVHSFPELREALDEHMRDNDELLPHVFYGDVSRWFVDRSLAGDKRAAEFARWLEAEFERADESVDNLIAVSFLENLPWPPDPDAERVAAALGPSLRRTLRAMQDWRPAST